MLGRVFWLHAQLYREKASELLAPDYTCFDALRAVVRHYTLEAGVRGLSRQLATVCRKVARARATGDARRHTVLPDRLEDYLGARLYQP